MARIRDRLLRPRHLLATATVFLLFSGVASGIVGYATAQDATQKADAAQEPPFHLAVPQAGDQGRYELQGGADGLLSFFGRTWIEFQWLPDVATHDGDGHALWANQVRLHWNMTQMPVGQQDFDIVYYVRPGTGDAVAQSRVRASSISGPTPGTSYSVQTDFRENEGTFLCGFRTLLQGRDLALTGAPITDSVGCAHYYPRNGNLLADGTPNPFDIVPIGMQVQDGVRYLEVDEVSHSYPRGHYFRYWYREDLPYPVRIEGSRATDGALVLTGFEAGHEAIHLEPAAPGPDATPLVQAPVRPWGPDDTGVSHPFPLSEAYAKARDDASYTHLRDYLAAHPGAYTARAYYRDMVDAGTPRRSWEFTVTDGPTMLRVFVEKAPVAKDQGETPAGPLPVPLPAPPMPLPNPAAPGPANSTDPAVHYSFSDSGTEDASGQRFPDPAHAPVEMPTVASLMAQWQAFATPSHATTTPNFWRLDIDCSFDCPHLDTIVTAGHALYNRTYPDGDPQRPSDVMDESTLDWRKTSFPDRDDVYYDVVTRDLLERQTEWHHDQPTPKVNSAPSSTRPLGAAPRVLLAGVWAFPAAGAAGAVGVGSVLASLGYWAWPALKAGPTALFSRVRRDALLDNPQRATMMQAIEANPGIHHAELVRLLGKGNGAAEHHLGKLLDGGLVVRHKSAGFSCYFPKGAVDRREMGHAAVLKSPVAQALLEAARSRPGLPLASLARELGVSPPTIQYHLRRLQAAGLLSSEGGLRATDAASAA